MNILSKYCTFNAVSDFQKLPMLTSELLHINTYTVRKSYEEEKAVNHLQECTVQLSTVAISWGLSFNPKREKSL